MSAVCATPRQPLSIACAELPSTSEKTQELGGELEIRGEIQSPDLEAEIDDPFDEIS